MDELIIKLRKYFKSIGMDENIEELLEFAKILKISIGIAYKIGYDDGKEFKKIYLDKLSYVI